MSLFDLWGILWQNKFRIIAITTVAVAMAVVYALLAEEWYRADVTLTPAEERSTSGIAAQLGSFASLAGISVGGGDSAEPIAVLRSRSFRRAFIEEYDLMTTLLSDQWNVDLQRWEPDDPEDWPDIQDAVEHFGEEVLSVSEDPKTGLVTVAVSWTDPEVAATWANLLVERLNDRMRQRAEDEALANVTYLRAEIAKTNIVALQETIGRLLEAELQKLMLARGTQEFAFKVIDRAVPPNERFKPRRKLIVLLAAAAAAFFSAVGVLVVHGWDQWRRDMARPELS